MDPEESPDKDTPEAQALLDAMHAHAEEMCAGWLHDQEFYLWSAAQQDGRWEVNSDAVGRARLLRLLAAKAGGWWIHGGPEGRTFLPTDVWERRYAATTSRTWADRHGLLQGP